MKDCQPPSPLPRSTIRAQSLPRIAADVHVAPRADGRATASEGVLLDHFVDACLLPSQLLTFEMLRRPLESTLAASVRMVNDPEMAVADSRRRCRRPDVTVSGEIVLQISVRRPAKCGGPGRLDHWSAAPPA